MIVKIKEITAEIKKSFNEIYRKGTKEYQEGSVDNLTQAYILLQLLEEIKGLKEDLAKVEAPKVEEAKATVTPKAPTKTTK